MRRILKGNSGALRAKEGGDLTTSALFKSLSRWKASLVTRGDQLWDLPLFRGFLATE